MNKEEINEIVECMPKGRTPFYYFKDRYALILMSLAFDKPASKSDVQNAGFGRLLDKLVVKKAMGTCGSDKVSADICNTYWPEDYCIYMLSLGEWGSNNRRWDQMSRAGYNLVLQLNFSSEHMDKYFELVDPEGDYLFENWSHPISRGKYRTLAWARMDICLESNEALIEEIQNDWVRYARSARRDADQRIESRLWYADCVSHENVLKYVDEVLAPHAKLWDEAMLAATIWFLREEVGIKRIYYHTHKSGSELKRIRYRQPPRSLYTTLPRKFCFEETNECPEFLYNAKAGKQRQKLDDARFQSMSWE